MSDRSLCNPQLEVTHPRTCISHAVADEYPSDARRPLIVKVGQTPSSCKETPAPTETLCTIAYIVPLHIPAPSSDTDAAHARPRHLPSLSPCEAPSTTAAAIRTARHTFALRPFSYKPPYHCLQPYRIVRRPSPPSLSLAPCTAPPRIISPLSPARWRPKPTCRLRSWSPAHHNAIKPNPVRNSPTPCSSHYPFTTASTLSPPLRPLPRIKVIEFPTLR